jgi:hypothetical protein
MAARARRVDLRSVADLPALRNHGGIAVAVVVCSPWAGGSIQFGDGVYGGSQIDMTNGEIDDATLYNRVLTSTGISELS